MTQGSDVRAQTPGLSQEIMGISQTEFYQEYLRSERWLAFATKAKVATGGRCQGCDRETWHLHVHHLTYDRLGNEKATDVWVVCPSCHLKFHPHHKKRVNKARKKQGKGKIRGLLGKKKPRHRPQALKIHTPKQVKAKPWTPEERERLLAEAAWLIESRR